MLFGALSREAVNEKGLLSVSETGGRVKGMWAIRKLSASGLAELKRRRSTEVA